MNPLRGVYLAGRFYEYVNETFNGSLPLQTSVSRGQNGVQANTLGGTGIVFTIALSLDNDINVMFGSSLVGVSQWQGVSRLADLLSFLANGSSQPVVFVTPYGATYNVTATEPVAFTEKTQTPRDTGMEFRVDLTLTELI